MSEKINFCYLCEAILEKQDYFNSNLHEHTREYLVKLWNSPFTVFFCCFCKLLIRNRFKHCRFLVFPNFTPFNLEIHYNNPETNMKFLKTCALERFDMVMEMVFTCSPKDLW